jgi:hypothetical protein
VCVVNVVAWCVHMWIYCFAEETPATEPADDTAKDDDKDEKDSQGDETKGRARVANVQFLPLWDCSECKQKKKIFTHGVTKLDCCVAKKICWAFDDNKLENVLCVCVCMFW